MELIPVPDASGRAQLWINADHLASVRQVQHRAPGGIQLEAELKVDGIPLLRMQLGEHADQGSADAAFHRFLTQLQTPHGS